MSSLFFLFEFSIVQFNNGMPILPEYETICWESMSLKMKEIISILRLHTLPWSIE